MKNRSFISFFTITLFFYNTTMGQSMSPLGVILTFQSDTFKILDPWYFEVEIRNNDNVDIDIVPTNIVSGMASESSEIKLEIKNAKSKSWVDTKSIDNLCSLNGYQYLKLKPGKSLNYKFRCASPYRILEEGENELRISFNNFCQKSINTSYSLPVKINIKNYEGEDKLVFNYLLKLKSPNFILDPVIHTECDTSYISNAEYIAKNFPKSSFACYSEINLCKYYLVKANYAISSRKTNRELILLYLRNSKKYGILAQECKIQEIVEISDLMLSQLYASALSAYNYELPIEILNEFNFPLKR